MPFASAENIIHIDSSVFYHCLSDRLNFANCCAVQVETIGDAYMVSSGIPVPNPHHASELADMALTLCHGVTNFKVKHSPILSRCSSRFHNNISDVFIRC